MPVPRAVARLNRVGLNRVTRHVAPWAPGFGLVIHRGRRSGGSYQTPVNVFATADGLRIALTYGAASDWVQNVVAAGGCRIRTRGQLQSFTAPRIVRDPSRAGVSWWPRQLLRLLRVADFLDLNRAG